MPSQRCWHKFADRRQVPNCHSALPNDAVHGLNVVGVGVLGEGEGYPRLEFIGFAALVRVIEPIISVFVPSGLLVMVAGLMAIDYEITAIIAL